MGAPVGSRDQSGVVPDDPEMPCPAETHSNLDLARPARLTSAASGEIVAPGGGGGSGLSTNPHTSRRRRELK